MKYLKLKAIFSFFNQSEKLFQAYHNNDFKKAQALLASGVSIDSNHFNGNTLLLHAVKANALEWVKFSLDNGANPFVTGKHESKTYRTIKENAFNIAVFDRHDETLLLLLDYCKKNNKKPVFTHNKMIADALSKLMISDLKKTNQQQILTPSGFNVVKDFMLEGATSEFRHEKTIFIEHFSHLPEVLNTTSPEKFLARDISLIDVGKKITLKGQLTDEHKRYFLGLRDTGINLTYSEIKSIFSLPVNNDFGRFIFDSGLVPLNYHDRAGNNLAIMAFQGGDPLIDNDNHFAWCEYFLEKGVDATEKNHAGIHLHRLVKANTENNKKNLNMIKLIDTYVFHEHLQKKIQPKEEKNKKRSKI